MQDGTLRAPALGVGSRAKREPMRHSLVPLRFSSRSSFLRDVSSRGPTSASQIIRHDFAEEPIDKAAWLAPLRYGCTAARLAPLRYYQCIDAGLRGHAAAGFGALATRLGAALAMIVLVLAAFGAASLADVGAEPAEGGRKL